MGNNNILRDYAWKIMGNTIPDGLLVDSDVQCFFFSWYLASYGDVKIIRIKTQNGLFHTTYSIFGATPMAGPIATSYCWFMFRYIPLIPKMMFLWYPHIYTLIIIWLANPWCPVDSLNCPRECSLNIWMNLELFLGKPYSICWFWVPNILKKSRKWIDMEAFFTTFSGAQLDPAAGRRMWQRVARQVRSKEPKTGPAPWGGPRGLVGLHRDPIG